MKRLEAGDTLIVTRLGRPSPSTMSLGAVGRSGTRKRPDSSWTSVRCGRRPVREEDQKEFVAQVQHLETASCDLEVEATVLTSLDVGESA
jgi:predicted phosphoribosyltransferase